MDFGNPQNLGTVQPVGYMVLYKPSSMLVSFFILLNFCFSWAFNLFVGSVETVVEGGIANKPSTLSK